MGNFTIDVSTFTPDVDNDIHGDRPSGKAVLDTPTAVAAGSTGFTGTVNSDFAVGNVQWAASDGVNADITGTQAVTVTGTQLVNGTGLLASTAYTVAYTQDGSNTATSASFTTDAVANPVLDTPTAVTSGSSGFTGTVNTDTAGIDLGWSASDGTNAPITGTQTVSATGAQNITGSGLLASTTYTVSYTQGASNTVTSTSFTTDAATGTAVVLRFAIPDTITATTARSRVNADLADGIVYKSTTQSGTPPSIADIKSGAGSVDAQNQPTVELENTFNTIGLTDGQFYYDHYVCNNGQDSNVITTDRYSNNVVDTNALIVDKAHPSASDSNVGSTSSPWLTISNSTKKLVAGDVLYVKAATYIDDWTANNNGTTVSGIAFLNSGTANNRIIVERFPTDAIDTCIIDQQLVEGSVPSYKIGFYIYNEKFITIRGFEVASCAGSVFLEPGGLSDYVYVENMHAHNIYGDAGGNISGLAIRNGNNHIVRNNEVYDIRIELTDQGNTDSILLEKIENVCVEYNTCYGGDQGIYTKYPNLTLGESNATIRYNTVHDVVNGVHFAEFGDGFENELIHHNLIYDCTSGITIDTPTVTVSNGIKISNNTISGLGYGVSIKDAVNVELINNIINNLTTNSFYIAAISTETIVTNPTILKSDYNLFNYMHTVLGANDGDQTAYDSIAAWQGSTTHAHMIDPAPAVNTLVGTPLFTNEAGFDFTLQAGSPAKGAANDGGDMGCYWPTNRVIGAVRT